mmetsp:Transcript_45562/g.115753  ORF Transcript_45562/g.115753 Transcript_45562/m.115753 type:complete len:490 (-) Transcript_45562:207-1676(-)
MMNLLMINPVETVTQIVTLCLVVVVVAFMIKHWDRVMVALTGDDRIHGSPMDCMWFTFFRCCGTCNGDWTRCLSKCSCCPTKIRNTNLVKKIGKWLGLTTYTVELKNIVIGDLPVTQRCDFYIQVECAANPPMTTALAEEKLPKVVHFPEIITLRIRWSMLEHRVKITVKELNVFGSTDICTCFIGAMQLIDWAGDPSDCIKRFEMKPTNTDGVRETPAWILLEIGLPSDDRDLDNFHDGGKGIVRTATKQGHYNELAVKEFKHEYALLDASGHAMQEPLEEDLAGLECCSRCFRNIERFLMFWGAVGLLVPSVSTVYANECYRHYRWITMARLAYPDQKVFSHDTLLDISKACHLQFDGTGSDDGSSPCRPTNEAILETCKGPDGGHFPTDQPPVRAFEDVLSTVTMTEHGGVSCPYEVCWVQQTYAKAAGIGTVGGWVAYFLLICCVRFMGFRVVDGRRRRLMTQRAEQAKMISDGVMAPTRAGFLA